MPAMDVVVLEATYRADESIIRKTYLDTASIEEEGQCVNTERTEAALLESSASR
jgi:hypothetical protein